MSLNLVLLEDSVNSYNLEMLEKEGYKKYSVEVEPLFLTSRELVLKPDDYDPEEDPDPPTVPGAGYITVSVAEGGEYNEILNIVASKEECASSFDASNQKVLKIVTSAGFFSITRDARIYAVQVVEITS